MTGAEKIRAAAKRILGPMDAFKTGLPAPAGAVDVIGRYEVLGGPGPVWVTAAALLVPSGCVFQRIDYLRMREVHAPGSKDAESPESGRIRVVLIDGGSATIDIVGKHGRFCDSFEFARFLARASEFAREPSATPR